MVRARFGHAGDIDAPAKLPFSRFVDAAVANGPAQPPGCVRGAVDAVQLPEELQEYVLRQFRGGFPIAEETHCQAENQRLVVLDDADEIKTHIRFYG